MTLNQAIQEVKRASMGDPGTIPDPVTPKGGSNHHRGADKSGGEKGVIRQGKSPQTRAAMMSDVMNAMRGADTNELKGIHKTVTGDGRNGPGEPVILQGNSKLKEALEKLLSSLDEDQEVFDDEELEALVDYVENGGEIVESVEPVRITEEDVDTTPIIEMLTGSGLSDEAAEKIATIFEAEVVQRVNETVAEVSQITEAEVDEMENSIVERIDQYLDYVVGEWLENNELAVEGGIRAEIAESFLAGLGNLFAEHYIEVPEDSVDVVDALGSENHELEESLNTAMEQVIDLTNEVERLHRDSILNVAVDGMTAPEAARLVELADGVAFEDEDTFERKVFDIRENYFGEGSMIAEAAPIRAPVYVEDDEELSGTVLTEDGGEPETRDPAVNAVLNTLRRSR